MSIYLAGLIGALLGMAVIQIGTAIAWRGKSMDGFERKYEYFARLNIWSALWGALIIGAVIAMIVGGE